ncbi:MAG: ABC transporter permease [Lachnospira sp.]|nr:ABC transporter permease [Lachnospira sp.]
MNSIRFHLKLATANIKKNKRLYIPHIFAEAGLIAMFYIMMTLQKDENLVKVASQLLMIIEMGVAVVVILSFIIVLYTNSFLMKQRKREFGLYNVLGMNKADIGHILFFENFISYIMSSVIGIGIGILLYKLCTSLICKILKIPTILGFYISIKGIIITIGLFFVLFFITYIYNQWQIIRLKPSTLLLSNQMGEKEPKIKWILLLLGLLFLGGGYYLAITIESPLQALEIIFIAIILVIIGTYFLFVAGTIALLKSLKKNKKYYYQPNHMTAVSGLLYRMKQNAVGLSSICILATGVLVMLSTTVSLYAGVEDSVNSLQENDLQISGNILGDVHSGKQIQSEFIELIKKVAKELDIEVTYLDTKNYFEAVYEYENGNLLSMESKNFTGSTEMNSITLMTASEYERLMGIKLNLQKNQVACMPVNDGANNEFKHFYIDNMEFENVYTLEKVPSTRNTFTIFECYFMVVSDETVMNQIIQQYFSDLPAINQGENNIVALDYNGTDSQKTEFEERIKKEATDVISNLSKNNSPDSEIKFNFDSKKELYQNLYQLVGGFLFLGIMLGIVFVFATAIIIYYKQISEGYEDRHRFVIMQKVGMSNREVQKSIRSQIFLVFFLPLIVAIIHLGVAFKPLNCLLQIFFMPNSLLFLICAVISVIIFAVIYGFIYSITAKTLHHTIYSKGSV